MIDVIKNNGTISKLGENKFCLCPSNAERFADQAWQLLGKYIANNTHLDDVDLDGCSLTDQKMYALFSGLVKSSLSELDIQSIWYRRSTIYGTVSSEFSEFIIYIHYGKQ